MLRRYHLYVHFISMSYNVIFPDVVPLQAARARCAAERDAPPECLVGGTLSHVVL